MTNLRNVIPFAYISSRMYVKWRDPQNERKAPLYTRNVHNVRQNGFFIPLYLAT